MANLWSGRFEKGMDEIVEKYNASILFDKRMYEFDIKGSIAHVTMLGDQGIISAEDKTKIIEGLNLILEKIKNNEIEFSVKQEDIHMAVEENLIKLLRDTGKKLHTARSRNDQGVVDTKMYVRFAAEDMLSKLGFLQHVLLEKSQKYIESIMSGYTHMQHAQPVTIGFHLMAYFQMFRRDMERLQAGLERMNYSPLGSCALAGTTFPIDRHQTASLLGFSAPTENAMDSVSDRDYMLDFLASASISMMHVSRISEEIVWWNSQEFSYIEIDDSFCTGSSIMPQKKNPDIAELLRGKVGRVYGDLMSLLTVLKGTPLSFNKDFQEDKESVFDAYDTWSDSVVILAKMLEKSEFRVDNMRANLRKGFLNATDVADNLVRNGIAFRDAHEIVGKMVKYCELNDKDFDELKEEEFPKIDSRITFAMMPDLTMEGCVNARTSFGGTAPKEVGRQIEVARKWLDNVVK